MRTIVRLNVAIVLVVAACQEETPHDEAFGIVDLTPYYTEGASRTNPAGGLPSLAPVGAYSQGERVEAYDFGAVPTRREGTTPVTAPVSPIYFLFDSQRRPLLAEPVREVRTGLWWIPGGDPTLSPNQADDADVAVPFSLRRKRPVIDDQRQTSAHQRPIIDVGPEALATSYTGLWEVIEVTVPDGYRPDAIKSWRTLEEALGSGAFTSRRTGRVINCPLIDERSVVLPSVAAAGSPRPIVEVWYRRKRGACLLANGWETLLQNGKRIPGDSDAARLETFDVTVRELNVRGSVQRELLVPVGRAFTPVVVTAYPGAPATEARYASDLVLEERPRRTAADPPGYTPIRWMWDVLYQAQLPSAMMGSDMPASLPYVAGTLKTMAGVPDTAKRPRPTSPVVRNLASIGPVPSCGPKADDSCSMASRCTALGLACNPTSCLCEPPGVGYGESCGAGFQRCRTAPLDDQERAFAPSGFVCHARQPRGFCLIRCDAGKMDETTEKGPNGEELDSRCSDLPGFVCVTPGASATSLDDKKESVCVRRCNPSATDDEIARVCQAPAPRSSGGVVVDLADGLRCTNQRNVTGCTFDFAYEPHRR